jgi:hypothetical protein
MRKRSSDQFCRLRRPKRKTTAKTSIATINQGNQLPKGEPVPLGLGEGETVGVKVGLGVGVGVGVGVEVGLAVGDTAAFV